MKIIELKKKIADADGKLSVGDIYFERAFDDDINVYGTIAGLIAWIAKSQDDDKEVKDGVSVVGDNSFRALPEQVQLAQFLGVDLPEFKPITVEKTVTVEKIVAVNADHLKLSGMVEAYEKILLGREITASK